MSAPVTKNMVIYMAYLLRYSHYPSTVADLQKMAEAKHFPRLAEYLEALPADTVYQNAHEALDAFKAHSGQPLATSNQNG